MAKIKIDDILLDKAKRVAKTGGYSSVDEFVVHCIEIELARHKTDETESQSTGQLRGLGYVE